MAHRVPGQGSLADPLVSSKAGADARLGQIAALRD
jgi:hypothetical protein